MKQSHAIKGKKSPDGQTTTDFPRAGLARRSLSRRCNIAFPGSTGGLVSQEMACVLRHRLLIAALIAAAGFTTAGVSCCSTRDSA